jgi:hypothetical protein
MTADEAKTFGLIDQVLEKRTVKPKDEWTWTRFVACSYSGGDGKVW